MLPATSRTRPLAEVPPARGRMWLQSLVTFTMSRKCIVSVGFVLTYSPNGGVTSSARGKEIDEKDAYKEGVAAPHARRLGSWVRACSSLDGEISATNGFRLTLAVRNAGIVSLDRQYVSQARQGVRNVPRSVLASLGRSGSRLPARTIAEVDLASLRFGVPAEHRPRRNHRHGGKREAVFGYDVLAYERERMLREPCPNPASTKGKRA